jgi:hypothetical protein
MHAGVAGGADGDEEVEVVAAGLVMVDDQPFPAPASLAPAAVTGERRLALAGEALAGMRAARVAAAAEPGNGRQVAAGAEERALRRKTQEIEYTAARACANGGYHKRN